MNPSQLTVENPSNESQKKSKTDLPMDSLISKIDLNLPPRLSKRVGLRLRKHLRRWQRRQERKLRRRRQLMLERF